CADLPGTAAAGHRQTGPGRRTSPGRPVAVSARTAPRGLGSTPVTSAQDWIAGARPRTLPAAVAPVLVGTAAAHLSGGTVWWKALLALVVSLALQVGVNYANDYSDGIRGTDADRVGP